MMNLSNEQPVRRLIFGTRGYHWFERVVIAVLTVLVSVSVVLTLAQSAVALYQVVMSNTHMIDHDAFITVFGTFMTVLIALEFNHTVLPDITAKAPLVKVRAVLLVALLALARKVVLVDFKQVPYTSMIGLAVLIIAVGVAYWALQPEDRNKN
ncbi:MAG: phosphate-starvation-inducible PsiE family protein [Desulfuromonadaceae bacterium]|nr:phosphate-starvation-inducible PsiE family protein [Desulfuromonadaceae bacterium]